MSHSVNPVFVFDAARLWPEGNGTRFGIGGGVRFTLVNFNITVGYAVNPNFASSLGTLRADLFEGYY